MSILTNTRDLGKAFEKIKAEMMQEPSTKTCSCCGNTYYNSESGGSNPLNLPSLVRCHERPNNQEAYPYFGCPVCGTDDYLK